MLNEKAIKIPVELGENETRKGPEVPERRKIQTFKTNM
jgi:hypothetical protein